MSGNRRVHAIALVTIAVLALVAFVGAAGAVTGAPVPVNVGGVKPDSPAVSGTRVVWSDYLKGQWDVWLYDASTKQTRQITSGAGDKLTPSIDGDTVVYTLYVNGQPAQIYRYDIPSQISQPVSSSSQDQLNPSVSGSWVVWEENSSATSGMSVIKAINLTGGTGPVILDSGTWSTSSVGGGSMHRPKVSGNVVVWEFAHSATGDSDVRAYELSTNTKLYVASSSSDEHSPATDGRYVVWSQFDDGTGYDIWAEDLTSANPQPFLVAGQDGEQSLPVIGNGVVSWVDAGSGKPVVRSENLGSGATADFPYRGAGAVAGFSAAGDATTWLQQDGSRWQVKALFGSPIGSIASLRTFAQTQLAVAPSFGDFRFALLSSAGDSVAPTISSTSVKPGQTSVSRTGGVSVSFSKPMNSATINSSTMKLLDARTGKVVPASVRYSWLTRSATVVPASTLGSGSYTLSVSPLVADTSGNLLSAPTNIGFATIGTMAVVDLVPPGPVSAPKAQIVDANADVRLVWGPAPDDVGPTGYYVRRAMTPMVNDANWNAAELVTQTVSSVMTATVTPSVTLNEKAKKSAVYYAIRAVDASGNLSTSWVNISPMPHGMYVFGGQTDICTNCHHIHGAVTNNLGALGARGAQGCYVCHGSTSATAAAGAASVNNIQADFFDYPSMVASWTPTMGATPSRHGNAYIRAQADNQQCDMCHTPHKKPYDDTPANSYSQLLKRPTSATATLLYSRDSSPAANFNETFCFTCHGSSVGSTTTAPYAYMVTIGGSTAYDNAGGDHNQTGWNAAATAHGSVNMTDVARVNPAPNNTTLPKNNCEVCHDKHGSNAPSLLAYRRSAATSGLADGGALCFKCHSASAVAPDNGWVAGRTYNTWNGRDVKAEFSRTGSHHPISAGSSYQTVVSSGIPGLIDTQADWTTYSTPINTSLTDTPGSVVLSHSTVSYPTASYIFYNDPNANTMDSYNTTNGATGTWDADFTPVADTGGFSTGAGSVLVSAPNGKIYKTRGGSTTTPMLRVYTPPADPTADSWATATNSFTNGGQFGDGAQATVNTGSNAFYVSRGGSNVGISWFRWTDSTSNNLNYSQSLGVGSGLAYAATANRLFLVNRNGNQSSGDGRLYYTSNPGLPNNTTPTWNSAVQVTSSSTFNSYYGRLVYFKDGSGNECLMYLGTTTGGGNGTMIVTGLNGTPAVFTVNTTLGGALGAGCDIEWDGANGGYIYATRGGGNAGMWRIKIPTTATSSGNWTSANNYWTQFTNSPSPNPNTGSCIAIQTADPVATMSSTQYVSAGTLTVGQTSSYLQPAAGDTSWSSLAYDASVPANSTLSVAIKDASNGTTIASQSITGAGSLDLSSFTTAAYPKLQLLFTFSNSVNTVTPQLNSVTMSSQKQVLVTSGVATCYSCHNTHFVGKGGSSAWDLTRASNPTDTSGGSYSGTDVQFCNACHGGTNNAYYNYNSLTGAITISPIINANQLIPYTVTMRSYVGTWPFFTGWFKGTFTTSGHYTTSSVAKATCDNCHDPHGSNHDALLAWTTPSTWTTAPAGISGRSRDNTDTRSAQSYLCLNCHGNATTGLAAYLGATAPAANGVQMDVGTALNATYGHGPMIQADAVHHDNETTANLGAGNRHAECVDCHDPHSAKAGVSTTGTAVGGAVLSGAIGVKPVWSATNWTAPTGYTSYELAGASGDYESYLCFKCHSSSVNLTGVNAPSSSLTEGTFQETNIALEFNPYNYSGHNVVATSTANYPWPKTSFPNGYTWATPNLSLATGWSSTSGMVCSDCHSYSGTGARGPHGSSVKYMIIGGDGTDWWAKTMSSGWSTTMCARCHTTRTSNTTHNASDHNSYQCQDCHIRIPHGWKRPRMLRYATTDSMPYSDPTNTGLTAVALKSYTANGPGENDCGSNCGHHGTITGSTW